MIKKEIEGAALLSIYNELKDEIKAIRTDIQHLHIQQPQQSENNQELNSLLKETIVNAVNDTINAYINSRENYADEVSRRCKNTIDLQLKGKPNWLIMCYCPNSPLLFKSIKR